MYSRRGHVFLHAARKQLGCQSRKCLTRVPKLSLSVQSSAGLFAIPSQTLSTQINANGIIKSPFPDVTVPEINLAHYVLNSFRGFMGNTCLVDGHTGKTWTYAEVQDATVKVASSLVKQGFQKGDMVTLFSPNCPEFVILHLAVNACGGVVSPVNPVYTAAELEHAVFNSESTLLVTAPVLIDVAKAVKTKCQKLKEIIVFGQSDGCRPFSSLLEDDGKAFPENIDIDAQTDLCGLPYSSGTTGLPKGVMLSHFNVVANLEQMNAKGLMDYTSEDVFMGVLPFFHIYGLVAVLFLGMQNGSKIVSVNKFEPAEYLQLTQDHRATRLHVVPPILLFLAKHPMVAGYDISTVHDILVAAAPVGDSTIKECVERIKVPRIRQGYGMTELSPASNIRPYHASDMKYHTVGPPLASMEHKVVDLKTGETLGQGQEGELVLRGPNVMQGYFKNEKATEETIQNGWLHTGDIAYYDEDHEFIIADRLKELIKVKGLQVAPAELEALLVTHPSVQDSAVIGVPDERAGELPRAYVVLKPNMSATEEDIKQFVKEKVAPFKQLEGVEFRSEIPKSASGKILRKILRAELKS